MRDLAASRISRQQDAQSSGNAAVSHELAAKKPEACGLACAAARPVFPANLPRVICGPHVAGQLRLPGLGRIASR
jgi:hypothetical protein